MSSVKRMSGAGMTFKEIVAAADTGTVGPAGEQATIKSSRATKKKTKAAHTGSEM